MEPSCTHAQEIQRLQFTVEVYFKGTITKLNCWSSLFFPNAVHNFKCKTFLTESTYTIIHCTYTDTQLGCCVFSVLLKSDMGFDL